METCLLERLFRNVLTCSMLKTVCLQTSMSFAVFKVVFPTSAPCVQTPLSPTVHFASSGRRVQKCRSRPSMFRHRFAPPDAPLSTAIQPPFVWPLLQRRKTRALCHRPSPRDEALVCWAGFQYLSSHQQAQSKAERRCFCCAHAVHVCN